MLLAGILAIVITGLAVNWYDHYEIICTWPVIIAGAGGGAAALSGSIVRKKEIGEGIALILVLLLATCAIVLFKRFEYLSWRKDLIQSASQSDSQFAVLSLNEKEQTFDDELKTTTGHTGYLGYLMLPHYNLDLNIEVEDVEILPIHIKFKDTTAIVFKFFLLIVEGLLAYGGAFGAYYSINQD